LSDEKLSSLKKVPLNKLNINREQALNVIRKLKESGADLWLLTDGVNDFITGKAEGIELLGEIFESSILLKDFGQRLDRLEKLVNQILISENLGVREVKTESAKPIPEPPSIEEEKEERYKKVKTYVLTPKREEEVIKEIKEGRTFTTTCKKCGHTIELNIPEGKKIKMLQCEKCGYLLIGKKRITRKRLIALAIGTIIIIMLILLLL
jgi:hypothetical protein